VESPSVCQDRSPSLRSPEPSTKVWTAPVLFGWGSYLEPSTMPRPEMRTAHHAAGTPRGWGKVDRLPWSSGAAAIPSGRGPLQKDVSPLSGRQTDEPKRFLPACFQGNRPIVPSIPFPSSQNLLVSRVPLLQWPGPADGMLGGIEVFRCGTPHRRTFRLRFRRAVMDSGDPPCSLHDRSRCRRASRGF